MIEVRETGIKIGYKEVNQEELRKFVKQQNKIGRIKKETLPEKKKRSLDILIDCLTRQKPSTYIINCTSKNSTQLKRMIIENNLKRKAKYLGWF